MNIEDATVNVLLEVDGRVYMVAMDKNKYETIEMLTKMSAKNIIPTGRSQSELVEFIGYSN